MNIGIGARRIEGAELQIRQLALAAIQSMVCDHAPPVGMILPCKANVTQSPRIYVPSRTQNAPGHDNLRMTTNLHYCDAHAGELKIEQFLTDRIKADFEATARKKRPIDFKCDFDNAFIHYVQIFSPEYMTYIVASAKGALEKFGGVRFRG